MSVLQHSGRPYVTFNPASKQHRGYYAEFRNKNTWGHCPVRFILAEDQDNVITMIQNSLAEFHTSKEFGKTEA